MRSVCFVGLLLLTTCLQGLGSSRFPLRDAQRAMRCLRFDGGVVEDSSSYILPRKQPVPRFHVCQKSNRYYAARAQVPQVGFGTKRNCQTKPDYIAASAKECHAHVYDMRSTRAQDLTIQKRVNTTTFAHIVRPRRKNRAASSSPPLRAAL